MSLLPCGSCPWRIDQNAAAVARVRPRLKARQFRTMVGEEDGFRPIMQCHGSPDENPRACAGYVAREGRRNINVRILIATGRIASPVAVDAACDVAGIELHGDYRAVLRKLAQGA